ncbi:C4-dicarboxylate transporter DctA [Geothrix mesophila]|uniref:C4-dicarboxylate transporter DctA n=1 Tax=Geothrix mesophila TaxID=2922723 RepID=UPI001FACAAA6|nr:C4-dicarboxylate transporter DctA [Geothrix sp. SG198]
MFKRAASKLYNWVAVMIVLGALLGHFYPAIAVKMQPAADGFINLIKMLIPPVIMCSVVLGIAGSGSIKKAGRVGGKAILYFEIVSTLALVIGLVMANVFGPGRGFHADPSKLDPKLVANYVTQAQHLTVTDHLLKMIPKTLFSAFTEGDILQVLLISVLMGFSLAALPDKVKDPVIGMLDNLSKMFFGVMKQILYLAPLGAGAAIAYTIGKFGLKSLIPMAQLIFLFYATCAVFIFVVLGIIARLAGFNIFKVVSYIKSELLLVMATSSSESALIPLMDKMEKLGLSKSIVGLVIPTGYSFNLDGTNIYMTLASLFIAQALGIELTLGQQLGILVVAMITSKGAAGVTGSGFITLAATLAVVPTIPVAGMALILGIDKFMSEARAITNHIGNCIAAVVMASWEKELDWDTFHATLGGKAEAAAPVVEVPVLANEME